MQANERIALARSQRLLVEEIESEVVVYDLDTDHAHLLNEVTAAVWRLCDGSSSVGSVATAVSNEIGTPVTPLVIQDAVEQLSNAGLLETEVTERHGMTRRQLIVRAGVAAVAIPVVTSIIAPTAAAAASAGLVTGSTCTADSECASNCCKGTGGTKTCISCAIGTPTGCNSPCTGVSKTCNTTSTHCN
jgi:hypothetical protein